MGDKSSIEWLQGGATWNPIRARLKDGHPVLAAVPKHKVGWACVQISPGCNGCYAEKQNVQCGTNPTRAGTGLSYSIPSLDQIEIYLDEKTLMQPLRWKKGRLIFPCSMTDWMADFVPDEFRDKMLAVMALTPQHTYLTLTKRADRQREYLSAPELHRRIAHEANAMMRGDKIAQNSNALAYVFLWGRLENAEPGEYVNHLVGIADRCWPLPNLWLGVSAENQKYADERIPLLLQTTAAVRWVSAEPLLGDIDFNEIIMGDGDHLTTLHNYGEDAGIDWVVAGGESGPKARPMHPQWARSLRDQCVAAGVPFFFKQWGEWQPWDGNASNRAVLAFDDPYPGSTCRYGPHGPCDGIQGKTLSARVGKKAAGRLLDGREWNEYPEVKA